MKLINVLALSLLFAGGGTSSALSGGQLVDQGGAVVLAAGQLAGQGEAIVPQHGATTQASDDGYRSGAFSGFDQGHGVVWINDYLYWLHPEFKVIGNATKLGLLSAIKRGETVEFAAISDPEDPRKTLILEIRRK